MPAAFKTRIPSGIWSCLYVSFPSALNTWRAVGKLPPRSNVRVTLAL